MGGFFGSLSLGRESRCGRCPSTPALSLFQKKTEDTTPPRELTLSEHGLCDERGDVATASLLEVWIDDAERRAWFLFEASRVAEDARR